MALEEDLVSAASVVLTAEEVVETNFIQGCGTGIRGNVSTYANVRTLSAVHQDGSIPAQPCAVLALNFFVAREFGFLIDRNGVHVVGGRDHRHANALCPSPLKQATHDELGTLSAAFLNQRIQGLKPFGCLFRIAIRQLVCQPAEDMGVIVSCSHVQPLLKAV